MVCSVCKNKMTHKEFNFSIKNYGKILCRECQEKNSKLKSNFTKLKQNKKVTEKAIKLHNALIKKGFDAELEYFDGHKHVDIAIPSKRIYIEIDGPQHNNKKQALIDLKRKYYSFKNNFITLHIPNILMEKETIYFSIEYIIKMIEASPEQLKMEIEKND